MHYGDDTALSPIVDFNVRCCPSLGYFALGVLIPGSLQAHRRVLSVPGLAVVLRGSKSREARLGRFVCMFGDPYHTSASACDASASTSAS